MIPAVTILEGDCLERLRELPDESVHCVVTSPPYWGLRDYGTGTWESGNSECDHKPNPRQGRGDRDTTNDHGKPIPGTGDHDQPYRELCCKCGARRIDRQLGLERTPETYVAKMVEVFREVRRVLRKDGTCWVNLGDSYVANCSNQNPQTKQHEGSGLAGPNRNGKTGLKPKDLCGIPWRVAFALQRDGWWLRQEIIWSKPNPMPESVTDRCTKSHESIFLLAKSARYYFDAEAIKEPADIESQRSTPALRVTESLGNTGGNKRTDFEKNRHTVSTRNKRSVWTVPSQSYPESHFATFPEDLIKPCILAGTSARGCCPKCGAPWEREIGPTEEYANLIGKSVHDHKFDGIQTGMRQEGKGPLSGDQTRKACPNGTYKTLGWRPACECGDFVNDGEMVGKSSYKPIPCTVLDPFLGSGTTAQVGLELGRSAIGIELNPAYAALARQRTAVTPGLQLA